MDHAWSALVQRLELSQQDTGSELRQTKTSLAKKDRLLEEKDQLLAQKDAELDRLRALVAQTQDTDKAEGVVPPVSAMSFFRR